MSKKGKMRLTENNLRHYEEQVGVAPKPLNQSLLPTPIQSPFKISGSLFACTNVTDKDLDNMRLPTPPSSPTSEYSTSENGTPSPAPPPTKVLLSRSNSISISIVDSRTSSSSSFTPSEQFATCEVCHEEKRASAFPVRQCTAKCTHPPHTCLACVRRWIGKCVENEGVGHCECPECGERMEYEDVRFFADGEDVFVR